MLIIYLHLSTLEPMVDAVMVAFSKNAFSRMFGKKFEQKKMDVSDADIISENGPTLPYCLVGDEAFPLKEYLLRPYSGRGGLTKEKNIFNYKLSRARRIVENTFGILASQWRILRKPIIAKVETVEKIVASHCVFAQLITQTGH